MRLPLDLIQVGLSEHGNYHEFCRLLGRLKTNYQLSELVAVDVYPEWIALVADFTVTSLNSWQARTDCRSIAKHKCSHIPFQAAPLAQSGAQTGAFACASGPATVCSTSWRSGPGWSHRCRTSKPPEARSGAFTPPLSRAHR